MSKQQKLSPIRYKVRKNYWDKLLTIGTYSFVQHARIVATLLLHQCNTAGGYDIIHDEVNLHNSTYYTNARRCELRALRKL